MPADETKIAMNTGPNDYSASEQNVVVPLTAARTAHVPDDFDSNRLNAGKTQDGTAITSKRMVLASRLVAGLIGFSWLVAWPIGSTFSYVEATGTFGIRFGYTPEMGIMALMSVTLILFLGWAIGAGLRLEATARHLTDTLAHAGTANEHPQSQATRQQISALNAEVDTAIKRLAEAESLIRQQVKAINSASSAIETGAVKSTDRLERERKALMELTEEMNREAEGFAEKIAERSELAAREQNNRENRIEDKERELATQMHRLEAVSTKSLNHFETLASAMESRGNEISTASTDATERQSAIASQIEESNKRISTAQSELAEQSVRLEALIKDQRKRADRLAKIVTDQATRLAAKPTPVTPATNTAAIVTPSAPTAAVPPLTAQTPQTIFTTPTSPLTAPSPASQARREMPWKDILSQVDAPVTQEQSDEETRVSPAGQSIDAHPSQKADANQAPRTGTGDPSRTTHIDDDPLPAAMDQLINRLHNFSLVVQTQLFGEPSQEDLARFEKGERQIFSRALTTGNTEDLRQCIIDQVARNAVFCDRVQGFLRDFDSVLEPLSTEEGGENAIEAYLSAPIGRLYIVTGTAVDHFS